MTALPAEVVISSITLTNLTSPISPQTNWVGQLSLNFSKNAAKLIGTPLLTRKIPIGLTTAAWTSGTSPLPITGCKVNPAAIAGNAPVIKTGTAMFNACHANNCCQTVTFPVPFPTALSVALVVPNSQDYGHNSADNTSAVQNMSVTGFDACFDHILNTMDNNFPFYWVAFGN